MEKEKKTILVEADSVGQRLDKFCADLFPDLSRERVKQLIANGGISVKGEKLKPSTKVEAGWVIKCEIPDAEDATPQPEDIPLNILYEDDDLIVINKTAGMVVHPASGNWTATLVNALLYHCGETLSGIGGIKRPGIVHRLDKDTSGVMLVAKNDHSHAHLSAQLADRSLSRVYLALVWDVPIPPVGTIDIAIGRDHKNRLKQAVKRGDANISRHAITHYKLLQNFDDAMSLVECKLQTGRTHQIRVHMQAKGHPLVGDPMYGAQKTLQISRAERLSDKYNKTDVLEFPRQALHAHEIKFIHPRTNEEMHFKCPLPKDICKIIYPEQKDQVGDE